MLAKVIIIYNNNKHKQNTYLLNPLQNSIFCDPLTSNVFASEMDRPELKKHTVSKPRTQGLQTSAGYPWPEQEKRPWVRG